MIRSLAALLLVGSACAAPASAGAVDPPAQTGGPALGVAVTTSEALSPVTSGAVTGGPASAFGAELDMREAAYARLAADSAAGSQTETADVPLVSWPIDGRTSSLFGPRWGGFHNGLDIAAPLHTPIRATAAGQVTIVGKPYLVYGDTATLIVIAHAKGFATVYVHLSDDRPPVVKVGQNVAAGQVIAYNGSTGWSTGPHVHFMVVADGRSVDPRVRLPSR